MKPLLRTAFAAVAGLCAAAAGAVTPSPYTGQQEREIRSLSADEIAGLLEGRGMGYAKVAELNAYPGPAHVLELTSELELSSQQVAQTRAIFERMRSAARTLGARLVEAERALDASFRNRDVTPEVLRRMLEEAAGLEAELRLVHLRAHLEQAEILVPEQIARYDVLRGYSSGATHGHDHGKHGHHRHGHK